MRIKIAVLAIVAFAIAGRKTAIFQQRNGLLAPCSEDADEPINAKSSVISKQNFADLYHLFAWTVTYCHCLDYQTNTGS